MTNMFDSEIPADPIEAVKAKYGNDPEKMVTALAHSQAHIARLEAENKEFARTKTVEQIVQEFKESQQSQPQSQVPTSTPAQSVLPDDTALEQKLEKLLREKAEAERKEAAKRQVAEGLLRHYGSIDKAKEAMALKSKELGMPIETLDSIGLTSPQALFQMFGIENTQRPTPNYGPTVGNIRTNMTETKGPTPIDEFREILKQDRSKAMSQEVQNAIMAKAMKQAGL
jgi:predicted ribosome quality control (RQC) complex YloA/Tae2 family protein